MRILIVLFLLFSTAAKAQTTAEVYNYITKGYITTLAQGLDFKKGYGYKEFIDGNQFTGSLSSNVYQFKYCKFYNQSAPDRTLAFMILLMKNDAVEKALCLPMPGSDADIYKAFYSDVTLKLYSDQKERLYQELATLFTMATKENESK